MENKILTIMTRQVQTVSPEESLQDVKRKFNHNRIRHLPVVSDDRLVGILSLTDVQRLTFDDNYQPNEPTATFVDTLIVSQIMQTKPVTVSPDDTVRMVADLLTKVDFHALPVVEEGKLVGIITTTDIISYLLDKV